MYSLGTLEKENLPEALSKVFSMLRKRIAGVEEKNFLELMKEILLPDFWVKLGKNSRCKLKDYFYFVVFLTSIGTTAEGGSQMLNTAAIFGPDADTFLFHLKKFTPREIIEITDKINLAIFQRDRRHFKRGFWKKAFPVAVDDTDDPFYGKKLCREVVDGKRKEGTNLFYRFSAITIIKTGVQFTLAVRPVLSFDQTTDTLKWLIEKAERIIQIKEIQLDRGFFTKNVINFLIQNKYKSLMPAVKNSRIKKILAYNGAEQKASFKYRFGPGNSKLEDREFALFITKNKNRRKRGQEKPKTAKEILKSYHVFATNKIRLRVSKKTLKKTAGEYGKRWLIETRFKMINVFRIKTTSKNFTVRLFCYFYSVIMYNLW
ncbi:MAG: transposase, partial [Candidatus Helarchaeota archaeon]